MNYQIYDSIRTSYYGLITHRISGTVSQSNSSALQNSWVYLLHLDLIDTTVSVLDSMETGSAGKYSFLSNDSLLYVYAFPDSSSYPNEFPTYYDTAALFADAVGVKMSTGDKTINFKTLTGKNPGGKGFISGKVTLCSLCKKNGPAAFVKLILADSNGIIQSYTFTDKSGNFSFQYSN